MVQQKYSVKTSLPAITNPTWTGFGSIREFKVTGRLITARVGVWPSNLLYKICEYTNSIFCLFVCVCVCV